MSKNPFKNPLDAMKYLTGYCLKNATCLECKLSDNHGDCVLSQIPCNWPDSIKTIKIKEENT